MKPIRVYPYEPKDQTPKFVMIKNKHAPSKDPEILLNMFFEKNLEVRPIKITLPHVKRVTSWKPMIKSVNTNPINRAGK